MGHLISSHLISPLPLLFLFSEIPHSLSLFFVSLSLSDQLANLPLSAPCFSFRCLFLSSFLSSAWHPFPRKPLAKVCSAVWAMSSCEVGNMQRLMEGTLLFSISLSHQYFFPSSWPPSFFIFPCFYDVFSSTNHPTPSKFRYIYFLYLYSAFLHSGGHKGAYIIFLSSIFSSRKLYEAFRTRVCYWLKFSMSIHSRVDIHKWLSKILVWNSKH